MSSNCNCNNNTRRNAIIRDNTQTDGSICILADQVFDGVKEILNASECVVTVLDPPGTVTELLSAVSSDAAAHCDNITVDPDCRRFSLVSCTLTSLGNCTYRLNNNDIITGRCLIQQNFQALMCFPDDSLLPCTLKALSSVQIIRSVLDVSPVFRCLCDGVNTVFVTGSIPIYIPSAGRFAPADISTRQNECNSSVPQIFPEGDNCPALQSPCPQNR